MKFLAILPAPYNGVLWLPTMIPLDAQPAPNDRHSIQLQGRQGRLALNASMIATEAANLTCLMFHYAIT